MKKILEIYNEAEKTLSDIKGWWPVYHSDLNGILPELHEVFSKQRRELSNSSPQTFLDLGSGDGAVVFTASKAGFEKAYGIELNPELADFSNQVLRTLESEGNIPSDTVGFIHDSYYPQLIPGRLRRNAEDKVKFLFENGGILDYYDIGTFTEALLTPGEDGKRSVEETIEAYFHPKPDTGKLQSEMAIRQNLPADMVFANHSDIFFDEVMIPLLSDHMHGGSRLLTVHRIGLDSEIKQAGKRFEKTADIPLRSTGIDGSHLEIFVRR